MAKIRFETGQVVNFGGNPTPQDIEEVAKSLNISKPQDIPKPSFYSEAVSPVLSGLSTFAGGIPKMAAKADIPGVAEAMYPEQQTVPGKLLRGASEVAGFTAGLPAKGALFAGRAIGKGIQSIPKFAGQQIAKRVASGAGAGAAGGALAGDTLESRIQNAIAGAAIPLVIGGAGKGISLADKGIKRAGAYVTGVSPEIMEDVSKKGLYIAEPLTLCFV